MAKSSASPCGMYSFAGRPSCARGLASGGLAVEWCVLRGSDEAEASHLATMKSPVRLALALLVASMLAAASACGGSPSTASNSPHASSTAKTSPSPSGSAKLDPEVAMPKGFPADVPIYPGSRLTAAAMFTANGQTTWGMEWETLDGIDKVQVFYSSKLSQGDWNIQ